MMFGFIQRGGIKSAWVVAIVNVIIFSLMSMIIPKFIEIFAQPGSELPSFTNFMLEFHNYTGIIGAAGLIGALLVQLNNHHIGWILIGISSTFVLSTIIITIIGMYLPIFMLGQVVSQ